MLHDEPQQRDDEYTAATYCGRGLHRAFTSREAANCSAKACIRISLSNAETHGVEYPCLAGTTGIGDGLPDRRGDFVRQQDEARRCLQRGIIVVRRRAAPHHVVNALPQTLGVGEKCDRRNQIAPRHTACDRNYTFGAGAFRRSSSEEGGTGEGWFEGKNEGL